MHRIGWWTHRRFTLTCTVFTCIFRCYCCWCCCFYLDINLRAFAEWDGKCVFSRRTQFSRFRWTFFTIPTNSLFFHFPLALCLFFTATSFMWHCLMIMFYSTLASKSSSSYLSLKLYNLIDHLVIGVPMCIFVKLMPNFFCPISIRK